MNNKLELISKLFSVLGKSPSDFTHDCFKFYMAPSWPTPSFSPIVLLPDKELSISSLYYIESYFQKNPIINPEIKNTPYFTFINTDDLIYFNAISSVCEKAGWAIEPVPLAINLFSEAISLQLSGEFSINIQSINDTNIPDEYKSIIISNFNANHDYINNMTNLFKNTTARSYVILIRNKENKSIAGGTVSIGDQIAFFTWGSVMENYRKQGLHQVLLSACQMVARSFNVTHCGLTTRNSFIKQKNNETIELYISRKIA